jgi:hypothetical protein
VNPVRSSAGTWERTPNSECPEFSAFFEVLYDVPVPVPELTQLKECIIHDNPIPVPKLTCPKQALCLS